MDWEGIAAEIGISVRKLRKTVAVLRRRKIIPSGDRVHEVEAMRSAIGRGQLLSVENLLILLDNPELLKSMGAKAEGAKGQIAALCLEDGVEADDAALLALADTVYKIPGGVQRLASWVQSTIPAGGCTYHYLAVRMVRAARAIDRATVLRQFAYAMILVRALSEMVGWFTVTEDRPGRRITKYHMPKDNA